MRPAVVVVDVVGESQHRLVEPVVVLHGHFDDQPIRRVLLLEIDHGMQNDLALVEALYIFDQAVFVFEYFTLSDALVFNDDMQALD